MSAQLDRGALFWGSAFTVIGLAGLLSEFTALEVRLAVVLPLVLITAGAVLALSAFLAPEGRR